MAVEFASGQVHALLGSNGSGKSTLIKVISGVVSPLPGASITVGDRPSVDAMTPAKAGTHGLRFVHQDLALLPELSILENFYLTNDYPRLAGAIVWPRARAAVAVALATVGLDDLSSATRVSDLSHAERVLVATVRALFGLPETGGFLFVDEPTAVLDDDESARLLTRLRNLAANSSVGIVLVTHRLKEVMMVTDRVTVLRDGHVVLRARTSEIDETVIFEALAGADMSVALDSARPVQTRRGADGDFLLEIEGLHTRRLSGLGFSIGAGEILGITGLEGAGKDDVVDVLFGLNQPAAGAMLINGAPYHPQTVRDALASGIGLVPADRHGVGGIGELSVGDNILLARFASFSPRGWFRRSAARDGARRAVEAAGVRPPDPALAFGTLSGGNQQKVILGRWLDNERALVILHEPTAGVDVGARRSLYARIRASARDDGLAVLVVSSDLVEVTELCDRALVLVEGQIAAVLAGESLTVEKLTGYSYSAEALHQEAS